MSETLSLASGRFWRAYPRETAGLATLIVSAALALAGAIATNAPAAPLGGIAASPDAPPAPPPLLVRNLAPQTAVSVNQHIPLASGPNPAAPVFALRGDSTSQTRALDCLTSAVYYEAGSEDSDGQKAVAQVVLNRVRHPAFPKSVCGVVYQGSTRATGCQFTFTCDGSLARRPSAYGWDRARKVAQSALAGVVYTPVGLATHYHANYVVPYWASSLAKNAVVGAHIFYRWAGGWGRPAAFGGRYAGTEPNSQALRTAALAAEAAQPKATEVAEAVAEIPGAEAGKPVAGRVAVRFNLEAARKAVEEAPREVYVEKFAASDNLRFALGGADVKADEKAFGKAQPETAGVAAGGGGGGGSPQL